MNLNPSLKGMVGEKEVITVIKSISDMYDLKYLTNVVVPYNKGITQIDLVIFSTRIFLCLEIKSWHGDLYIPDNISDNWRVDYGSRVINIFSPVVQNKRHTNALTLTSPNKVGYTNYVVFPTNPLIYNKHGCIGNMTDLINLINNQCIKYTSDVVDDEYNYFKRVSNQYFKDYMIRELNKTNKHLFED